MSEMQQTSAPKYTQAHGILVLNKSQGPTSARCLTGLKRLGQKKIGHAGTLDPMATGVLLVLLGHATKISGHLMSDGAKIYKGTLRLGMQTDTWDAEGTVTVEKPYAHITHESIQQAMAQWLGRSEQTVPPYSAAKHNGQPLYKLARAGKEAPVKVKEIEIFRMEVLNIELPYISFRVECSSGTYIRSLAHSLGMRLECGAVLTELTREYSHPFGLEVAHTLEEIQANPDCLQNWVMPIQKALPHWPIVTITKAQEAELKNGTPMPYTPSVAQQNAQTHGHTHSSNKVGMENKAIICSLSGEPLALAEKSILRGEPFWTILRGLWTTD